MSANEIMLDDLLNHVRAWRARHDVSLREMARLAGVDKATVTGIDGPDWAPTTTTLRAILRMMDSPKGRLAAGTLRMETMSLDLVPSLGAPDFRCLERVLRPAALGALGLTQLAAVCAHAVPGRTTADRAVEVARSACPAAAVHLVDAVAADPSGFRIVHWDRNTDYRGGIDLTGSALLDMEDEAYRAQLATAYGQTRASGLVRVSFLHRRGVGGRRTFYRLLVPFPCAAGGAEIVSVILPEEPQAARYLLPHAMRV